MRWFHSCFFALAVCAACSSSSPSSSSGVGAGAPDAALLDAGARTSPPTPARETITVRIAHLYAPETAPGPAVDLVSGSRADVYTYEKVASAVGYGSLTGVLVIPRVFGAASVDVFPAGVDLGDGTKLPPGRITSITFTENGVTDDQAVLLRDGRFARAGQRLSGPLAAQQGGLLVLGGTVAGQPALGFVVDGSCAATSTQGDLVASLAPGPHVVSFVDLTPGPCAPGTSPVVMREGSIAIEAGKVTAVGMAGTAPGSPFLAIPGWRYTP